MGTATREMAHGCAQLAGRGSPSHLLVVVQVEVSGHLACWPADEVALIRSEYAGRIEVTRCTGEVAHRPGPLDGFRRAPWVRVAPGVVAHPAHARRDGNELVFPGGWRVRSDVDLRVAPQGPPEPDPVLAGTDLRASEVLYLSGERGARSCWHGEGRDVNMAGTAATHARLHPHLVKYGRGTYVNLTRLRGVKTRGVSNFVWLVLDTGLELKVCRRPSHELLEALGLERLTWIAPMSDEARDLYVEGLRDFPMDLQTATREELRAMFGDDARRLIANVIWQIYRARRQGVEGHRGTSHRDFWYLSLVVVLVRAGFLRKVAAPHDLSLMEGWPADVLEVLDRPGEAELPEVDTVGPGGAEPRGACGAVAPDSEDLFILFSRVLTDMVAEHRFFTYRQFGFVDRRPDMRHVGTNRIGILVVVEKGSLEPGARVLREERGVSTMTCDGEPKVIASEFLAEDLRAKGIDSVVVMGYVDFDPFGWNIVSGASRHLERYGMRVEGHGYLVRASRFTPEEKALFAFPVPATNAKVQGMIRSWLAAGGGIGGRALGMHADHFPVDRVLDAFDGEMDALEGDGS